MKQKARLPLALVDGVQPTAPDPLGFLLNRRQIATVLNVTERTIAAWDRAGRIPSIRIGRTVRYDRSDVLRCLQRN